jgi:hypothetical protein
MEEMTWENLESKKFFADEKQQLNSTIENLKRDLDEVKTAYSLSKKESKEGEFEKADEAMGREDLSFEYARLA